MADTNTASQSSANASAAARAKRFPPLENNPEVMSALVHQLGLAPNIGFHDVYSIDDPDLLAFVPRPAYALLLVFPSTDNYKKFTVEEDAGKEYYNGFGPQEEVLWFKQTIGNACGLMALIHGVGNGPVRKAIAADSELAKFLQKATSLRPRERATLLEESDAFEAAHVEAAVRGDTAALSADAKVDLHYVCFVKSDENNLWEMDGERKGPINRGALGPDEDVLSEKALALGVKNFLKREEEAGGGELRFSLIALAPNFD